jgi:general L-amino acid transport system permease protein
MSEQFRFLLLNLPNLIIGFPGNRPGGLIMSLTLALLGIAVGFVVAILLSIASESRYKPVQTAAFFYVQLFRGIPLVLLLLIMHQILGYGRYLNLPRTPLLSALITLILYSSAYQAEIVRAGLRAVPGNVIDSARLMGSTPGYLYRTIRLRYAVHVMLPALTGQAISLFKDTSVVVILGVAELMTVARIALGSDIGNAPFWVPLYLVVGLLYFCIAFGLSRAAQRWERIHHNSDLTVSLANY